MNFGRYCTTAVKSSSFGARSSWVWVPALSLASRVSLCTVTLSLYLRRLGTPGVRVLTLFARVWYMWRDWGVGFQVGSCMSYLVCLNCAEQTFRVSFSKDHQQGTWGPPLKEGSYWVFLSIKSSQGFTYRVVHSLLLGWAGNSSLLKRKCLCR